MAFYLSQTQKAPQSSHSDPNREQPEFPINPCFCQHRWRNQQHLGPGCRTAALFITSQLDHLSGPGSCQAVAMAH